MSTALITRRRFLAASSATLAAFNVVSRHVLGGSNQKAPSEKLNIAGIGVGGMGAHNVGELAKTENIVAICDVDPENYAAETIKKYPQAKVWKDFRRMLDQQKDIDAVVIATPDHWHVPVALAAVRAGKDVYVEKPLGLSIEQNKALREAVYLYGRVFQYGTQQRSFSQHCGFACELLRNGYLGELKAVHTIAPDGSAGARRSGADLFSARYGVTSSGS